MGALKPWHIGLVLCGLACVGLVVGAIFIAVKKATKK